ncbi:lysozyme inhibitor LprI family protein [Rossellomorea vietnamensis]|uniref:lysozyme inhibitor LprI family protein n=1 Tax=Rossellomorea vietnamensis TaxID=218284 RepID=UPI00308ECEB7|nr:lysozyme inhibitor LprI family protein [Rossellomorea vietnamensis]
MKKSNWLTVTTLSVMVFVGMSACSQSSDEDAASKPESEAAAASTDSDDSQVEDTKESEGNEKAQSDETSVEESSPEQDPPVTKVEGKQAYLAKLDNIQKELDAMPDKKDSDKGATNAMKNYYGVSYEKYDDALNEIYSLLKEKLSPEVMAELKTEQVKWIEEKEAKAEKERLKYEGGTFENVAWYISLYKSTKDRCYELVEEYMQE